MAAIAAICPLLPPPTQMLLLLSLTLLMGTVAGVPQNEPNSAPEGEPHRLGATMDEGTFTVLVLSKTGGVVQQCSGSILSKFWVLTAAHCVNPSGNATEEVLVAVGRALGEMDAYAVEDVFVHGQFNILNDDFDFNIALLKLSRALPLEAGGLRAVPLPDATTPPPRAGLRCVAAGWASRVLNVYMAAETKPELQSIDCFLETCDSDSYLDGDGGEDNDGNTKICLSARDDCRTEILNSGDAGGPLVCGGVLTGVLSHARPARTGPAGSGGGWCVPRGPRAEGGWRPLAESAAQSLWALWGDVRALLWGRAGAEAWRLVSPRTTAKPVVPRVPSDHPAQPAHPPQPAHPAQPAHPVQPDLSEHLVQLGHSTQPADPAQPAEPAESAEPAHPAQPGHPVLPAHGAPPFPPAHSPLNPHRRLHERLAAALRR